MAKYLQNVGVKVNDRLAVCSENNLGWAIPLCASMFVGATICPLNPAYSKREFQHALNISKPKFIFVSPMVLKSMKNSIKDLPWLPTVILLLGAPDADTPSIDSIIAHVPSTRPENFKVTDVDPNQHIVSILCSSGTTGLPKGVMLTDKNYLSTFSSMLDGSVGLASHGQPLINLLPFFHAYFFTVLIMGFIAGTTGIVFSQFKEKAFLETIEKYKIEVLSLVPPLMVFLAKHPLVDKYDLSSLKIIWCGAAPLSRETELAVKKRLNNPEIRQGYGMTELTLSVLKMPENGNRPGSAGKLLAGCSGTSNKR